MAKKKVSERNERRDQARAVEKLGRSREKLAALEAGGTPERPLAVESASQIEPQALALSCLHCSGPNRLQEHTAETVDGRRLRLIRMACAHCGANRSVWFRIVPPLPS